MPKNFTNWMLVLAAAIALGWFVAPDFIRDFHKGDECGDIKARFETAIHYVGRSHVVTTINGEPGDDYYTIGYSGPATDAEHATMLEALAAWHSANCKGPINPNSEFWR